MPQTPLESSCFKRLKGALRRQKYVMPGASTNMSTTSQKCRNPWIPIHEFHEQYYNSFHLDSVYMLQP